MLSECSLLVRLDTVRAAASASVVGMVDRFPMMLSFEAASVGAAYGLWDGLMRAFCLDV